MGKFAAILQLLYPLSLQFLHRLHLKNLSFFLFVLHLSASFVMKMDLEGLHTTVQFYFLYYCETVLQMEVS